MKIILEEYPNYVVHDNGQIWSLYKGKFLKPAKDRKGYLYIGIKDYKRKLHYPRIHKLVAKAFLPYPTVNKNQIDHINGVKTDNHYTNLEWVSPIENISRAFNNGLRKDRVKLKKGDVLDMLRLKQLGKTSVYISSLYDITPQYVGQAIRRYLKNS